MIVRSYTGQLIELLKKDFINDHLYYQKLIEIKFNIKLPEKTLTLDDLLDHIR